MKHGFELMLAALFALYAINSGSALARSGGHGGGHRGGGHASHGGASHAHGFSSGARIAGFPGRPNTIAPLPAISARHYCPSTGHYVIDARECPPAVVAPQIESAIDLKPDRAFE